MLDALHVTQQGIIKSWEKAWQSIWWPKMGTDIENHVTSCAVCAHWCRPLIEPMIPSQLLELQWQKVATGLFKLDSKHYIFVTDYLSRYFVLVELRSETTNSIINVLKAIFARHGIPAACFSDNGPCFSADNFSQFAKSCDFRHDTSSLHFPQSNGVAESMHFPQSNGEAESTTETAKNLLRKSSDSYLGLQAYCTMPTLMGYSPAQLIMGR